MKEDSVKITLIGRDLAVEGMEFVYRGELEECEGCRMHKVCNNLIPKRRYRIVGIRNESVLQCNIHNEGVCAVEVIVSPVEVLIDSKKAILNSEITIDMVCSEIGCQLYDQCFPEGIIENGRYLVAKVIGPAREACPRGKDLKLVELLPKT